MPGVTLLWRRGFAGAASASGSVFGSACKQPTTNALRTMRAQAIARCKCMAIARDLSAYTAIHRPSTTTGTIRYSGSQVRVAAYPTVERVELLRLYEVVLISIQPARGTQLNGTHEATHNTMPRPSTTAGTIRYNGRHTRGRPCGDRAVASHW